MDCSAPGFLVLHCLSQFAHTLVHWVSDAIQPSHPLSSPSPPALSLSQDQGLFQWVGSSQSDGQNIGTSASASVLPMNIQGWFLLGLIDLLVFQFSLVAQSCLTLFDPMDYSTSGFLVCHQLPESTQTHVHWVSVAIQPSHPLSPPSLPALNLSQHQGIFKWVSCLHEVAKVLEFQLQHQSFQWIFRIDFL